MRIIAIKEMSAGNESVGEMWKETRIFSQDDTLLDVMKWVGSRRKNVTLTVPEDDEVDFSVNISPV